MLQDPSACMCEHIHPKQACKHLSRAVWLQCGDEGVALESCEFWSAFCEASVAQPDRLNPEILRPFLGRLVPVLLKNMVSPLARSTGSTPGETGAHPAEEHGEQSHALYRLHSCMAGMQTLDDHVPIHGQLA